MPPRPLDDKDARILEALRQNARISVRKLSEQIGLGITPCRARILRLEKQGHISGYTIKETAGANGQSKFMLIGLSSNNTKTVAKLLTILRCHKSVVMAFHIEGTHDYLVKVHGTDDDTARHIISDLVDSDIIRDTRTMTIIQQLIP